MWWLSIALSAALAAMAWRYAHARPRHRPFAALITVGLAADVARRALIELVIAPAREALGSGAPPPPLRGLALAASDIDAALMLAWPAGIAAAAALVFLREPTRRRAAILVAAAWALAATFLAVGYPAVRWASLARFYLAAEMLAVAAVVASWWSWWGRREMPSLTEGAIMVIGAIELGTILGWSPFGKGWAWQETTYFIAYAALALLHAGEVWGLRSSRSS